MFHLWFAAMWILMGLLWLRRAYVAEFPSGLTTLNTVAGRKMTQRERLFRLFLGVAGLLLGLAHLWAGLRH